MRSWRTCRTSRTTLSELGFRVFFCPDLPLDLVQFDQTPRPERADWRFRLAEDIARRGLKNPLIVLNHPRPKCPDMWLMVGTNRLWAIRSLGWKTAPAIVTGSSPVPAREIETWRDLANCFKDGEPYRSPYGIALKDTTPPELCVYPP